jgi:hypothetical protein
LWSCGLAKTASSSPEVETGADIRNVRVSIYSDNERSPK